MFTDRATHDLKPGDTVLVSRSPDGTVWPALAAGQSQSAVVLDPPILAQEPSWYDDFVILCTLNTSAGPCQVSTTFRWLVEPAAPALAA